MNQRSFPATLSYWEIRPFLHSIDLLIAGSGIVGLTTAIFYKRKYPQAKVLIVERGSSPSGASTKNAGFACFGSASEILSDLKRSSFDEVFSIVEQRWNGLRELRSLVGDVEMDYSDCGGFELFRNADELLFEECVAFISEANKELNSRTGLKETYTVCDNQISGFGFSGVNHLILNKHEGAIDTGKMMNKLLRLANEMEIDILNGMEVKDFTDSGNGVEVGFTNGAVVKCVHFHIATNGFASKLLPEIDVKPARAQVLITSPIEKLKVKGTFHMNEGFYYFRNVGNRLLFGGGRHLDKETETSTTFETTEIIQHELDRLLFEVILPKSNFMIDHRWVGIMGVGDSKQTIIKRLSAHASCAVRLGGMGIAIGTSIGKQSAEMIG